MVTEAYTGARIACCRDAELKPGAGCPQDGCRGKLYEMAIEDLMNIMPLSFMG